MSDEDLVDWADVQALGIMASLMEWCWYAKPVYMVLAEMAFKPAVEKDLAMIATAVREAYSAGGRDLMLWQMGAR